MHRCLQLALQGKGRVAPNPMVGTVLVHEDRIIGEGYHEQYGSPHAEVNCINSVPSEDAALIPAATLYVSLEPCAHFGKTLPCADLIIEKGIGKVVIGCRDPFPQVDGRGIEKLKAAGVEVSVGVLEKECRVLNKSFFYFHEAHRPYVVLKWAETANEKIASSSAERLLISNAHTNRMVHKWRSEEMAILVGTNTALNDDPELTNRHWPGSSPIRLVIDMHLRLPHWLKLFNTEAPTIVFNLHRHSLPMDKMDVRELKAKGIAYYQVTEDVSLVQQLLNALRHLNIQSVLVEGGAFLLQSFIDEGAWNEARIIRNTEMVVDNGLPAPRLKDYILVRKENILSDEISWFLKQEPG